jgi:hypothetical protein
MMNNKFFCGELNVVVADFENGDMSNLEYFNQFQSFKKAHIVLERQDGTFCKIEIGEIFKNHNVKAFDRYDEIEIVEQFEMDGHLITI